ncbi:hypothetical protein HK102_009045 [Quaeritorhiza haematococci]|nr:hypothetical protein HK102_009045 [Quaeritorhiza haematococci]
MTGPPTCRYFAAGNCRYGTLCFFSHDLAAAPSTVPKKLGSCKYFARGTCKYGDACFYFHDPVTLDLHAPNINNENVNNSSDRSSKPASRPVVAAPGSSTYPSAARAVEPHSSAGRSYRSMATLPQMKPKKNRKNHNPAKRSVPRLSHRAPPHLPHIAETQKLRFPHNNTWDEEKLTNEILSISFGGDFDIKDLHLETLTQRCPRLLEFTAGSQDTGKGGQVTPAGLKKFVDGCPELIRLILWSFTKVDDDACIYAMRKLQNLVELTITGHDKFNGKVTDRSLMALAGLLEEYDQRKGEEKRVKDEKVKASRERRRVKLRARRAQEKERRAARGLPVEDEEEWTQEDEECELDYISDSEDDYDDYNEDMGSDTGSYGSYGYGYSDMDDDDDEISFLFASQWIKDLCKKREEELIQRAADDDLNEEPLAPVLRELYLQDQSIDMSAIGVCKRIRPEIAIASGESVGDGFASRYVHSSMGGGPELFWF